MLSRGGMLKHKQASSSSIRASALSRPSTLYSSRTRQNVPSIVAQYSVGNIGEMVRKSTTADSSTLPFTHLSIPNAHPQVHNVLTLAKIPQRMVAEVRKTPPPSSQTTADRYPTIFFLLPRQSSSSPSTPWLTETLTLALPSVWPPVEWPPS